jgi:hypothetical protein
MISSSEEEDEETQKNNTNKWKTIRSTKRKKISTQHTITSKDIETNNRYDHLTQQPETSSNEIDIDITSKVPKRPPIFIYEVQNYAEMIKRIKKIADQEQHVTKSLANNIVKINCETPETYQKWQRFQ